MLQKSCNCPKVHDPKRLDRVINHLNEILIMTNDINAYDPRNKKYYQEKMDLWLRKTRQIISEV